MATNRDVKLTLGVETTGAEEIDKLKQSVEQLAKEGGDAAPEFQQLADEIDRLGQQAAALRTFQELADATDELKVSQQQAQTTVGELADRLQQLALASQTARTAQVNAATSAEEAAKNFRETRDALTLLRNSYDENGNRVANYKAEVERLTRAKIEQKNTLDQANAALRDANAAVREAEQSEAKLQTTYNRSEAALKGVNAALAERSAAFESARTAADQLGVSTDNVAAAQTALVNSLNRLGNEAATVRTQTQFLTQAQNDYADSQRRSKEASDAAAKAAADAARTLQQAFGTVGIRSAQELEAEIRQVRQAMDLVRDGAGLTGRELETAMGAGNARIRELERSLRGVTGQLTLADRAADLLRGSLGQIAAGNLIADGIGSLVEKVKDMGRQFIQANLEIDRLNRTMTQITGSTAGAAEKIAFLRDVANTAGIAVGDITDSFIRFQASASASGIAAAEVDEVFRSVTVAGSKMGLTSDRVALALDALSQIASKGTVSMEELRQQLGDSLPGALAVTAKGLGLTTAELIKLVETGQLTATQFFPAFRRGLEESFGGAGEKVQGLFQAFQRLRNEFRELYQQAADSTAFATLTASLDFLATNFKTISAAVIGFGQALLAVKVAQFVAGLASAGAATEKLTADTAAQTAATAANTAATGANTAAKNANVVATTAQAAASRAASVAATAFTGTLAAVTGAMGALGAAGRALLAVLGGLPGILAIVALNAKELGTFIGETVAKWGEAGAAMRRYEAEMAAQAAREKQAAAEREAAQAKQFQAIQRETLELEKRRKALEAGEIEVRKATEADGVRADLIERMARLYGDEKIAIDAAAEASDVRLKAAQRELEKRAEYIQSLEEEVAKRAAVLAAIGARNEKGEEELRKLQELLANKKQELDQSKSTVESLKVETAERKISAETYADNSKRVGEFREALAAARDTERDLIEMQRQGLPVQEALANARLRIAELTRLTKDAVDDLVAAKKLEARETLVSLEATRSSANAEMELLQAKAASARASGDIRAAMDLETQAKRVKLEVDRISLEIKRVEIELERAELKIRLENLDVNDKLYESKKKELELRIKMTDIKSKEIESSKELINIREQEVNASARAANALGRETGAREGNIDSINKERDALEAAAEAKRKYWNVDKDGFTLDANGQRMQQSAPTDRYVLDTAKAQGLTDQQAIELVDRFIRNGEGVGNTNGMDWFSSVNKAISDLVVEEARKRANGEGGSQTTTTNTATRPTTTTPTTATSGGIGGRTININLNGINTPIGVSTQEDADKLGRIFQQIEEASRRS